MVKPPKRCAPGLCAPRQIMEDAANPIFMATAVVEKDNVNAQSVKAAGGWEMKAAAWKEGAQTVLWDLGSRMRPYESQSKIHSTV
ncbi:hypothetical protein Y1Q_0002512 [Alligator mississippiensis]|uniref:Uncharacterized protein n=1 Tax=Alligator mississippiensis TaxID=8496 RepID=A0A151N9N1_ALLMI|nr:hypothetical protein Y1Q_0002512 [Alligator mississippiensis]